MSEINDRREVYFYGNVGLQRVICPKCERWCIILKDDMTPCCKVKIQFDDDKPPRWFRSATPEYKRRPLKLSVRQQMLKDQNYRCAYCGQEFGSMMYREEQEIILSVEFDHHIPFAYNQNNRPNNFLAACQVCNGLKGSLIFKDMNQAQEYLRLTRKDKGYDF